ncbi:MAG: CARDB domain-containing protein [Candidatus Poseidoniaceae archaeon]
MANRTTVVFVLFMLITTSLMGLTKDTFILEDEQLVESSSTSTTAAEIASWRIGDKWTYETQFDVAQLIAQANVSASLNTLTGDTVYEVEDIFFINVDGIQTLAYKLNIEGDFSSGNGGATLEGVSGRLDIGYSGEDIIRVRDQAVINSEFELDVDFAPFNLGFLTQNIAVINFDTYYDPPKERYDFPLRTGDQWYMPFMSGTSVSGSSDYFDPSEFDTNGAENNSWQVTTDGIPTEDGQTIKYEGCDESYKVNEWNATGVSSGFNWYCPAARFNSWIRISNAAGFTIDWLLKDYEPVDSFGVDKRKTPGDRNVDIEVTTQFVATLPDSMSEVYGFYAVAPNNTPEVNKNLQLRYEMTGTLLNPTTDSNGKVEETINVSNVQDDTTASDDYTSNGVIVWDPVQEIIGVATIVIDLSVVGIDLVAQEDSIIVTRTRDTEVATLSKSIGYNALPGDLLSFSLPAQNRGVLTSPSTEMEVIVPGGESIRQAVPAIDAYSEQRIIVDWTVPEGATIGNQSLTFTVDPDELIAGDANRSNNQASVDIFIGRTPNATISIESGKYSFEDVFIDARSSFDPDGGDVECRFEVESRAGLIDVITTPDCAMTWNWTDGGVWELTTIVTDDELDSTTLVNYVTILNRAPFINLSHPTEIAVETQITIDATDSGDVDTTSPSGQQVSISWPDLNCQEGLTQPTCTFTPMEEGPIEIKAIATDDDGAQTEVLSSLNVLNIAPEVGDIEVWIAGVNTPFDSNGTWVLAEDQTVILRAQGSDSLNDRDQLILNWNLSDLIPDLTVSTDGSASDVATSWPTSGPHIISVRAVDDDGISSEPSLAMVTIENVAPTITAETNFLDAINRIDGLPVFENDMVVFDVTGSDTASDMDTLEICWDIDGTTDSDLDGTMNNDCDVEGDHLETMWDSSGYRTITAWVMDDDGEKASLSAVVKVMNRIPTAKITYDNGSLDNLVEGDVLNITAFDTVDTESDLLDMLYVWDYEWEDTNLDGEGLGDVDATGISISIEDLPAGTWTITLTVTDDDLASSTQTLTISVDEKPPEGILEEFSEALGVSQTMSIVIILLVVMVLVLASFLAVTRRSPSEDLLESASSNKMWDSAALPTYESPSQTPAYEQTAQQTQPVAQPSFEQPTQANQGPPLPAGGLPQGWTMEQWAYYGEQYLQANQPSAPVAQPTPSMTPTTQEPNSLSSLLDDLDL